MTAPTSEQGASTFTLFEPDEIKFSFKIISSANQNPDHNGRPSPLVLRVYQLSDETLFKNSDFYDLYDDDIKVLGRSLKHKDEFSIPVGQTSTNNLTIHPQTRFISILGGFQDLDNAKAKLSFTIDPKEPEPLCIRIEEKSLVMGQNC
ncbi:MAG: type VI secretion system lipoprotein TssJ [Algicola sp.]|nr:type VI secretion system lipoprotein TssJ [Algicola sp.]